MGEITLRETAIGVYESADQYVLAEVHGEFVDLFTKGGFHTLHVNVWKSRFPSKSSFYTGKVWNEAGQAFSVQLEVMKTVAVLSWK